MKVRVFLVQCVLVALALVGMTAGQAQAIQAPQSVLVLGDGGNVLQTSFANSALGSRFSLTYGDYATFDGAGVGAYTAVVLMPWHFPASDMPALGQTALLSYISQGGGLVTTGYTDFFASYGFFGTLQAALPGVYAGQYTSSSWSAYIKATSDPVINYNLPDPYFFMSGLLGDNGKEVVLNAKSNATVLWNSIVAGSTAGTPYPAGLVGWSYGQGKVASFSILASANDPNYQQLFANTVLWADRVTPTPIPAGLFLLAPGLVGLIAVRRKFKG